MVQTKAIAPYIRRDETVQNWGLSITTALLPVAIASVYMQGATHGISQGVAVLFNILLISAVFIGVEFLFTRILSEQKREMDFFSFAEGLSVALVLPVHLPRLYIFAIAFVMAFFGKQILETRYSFFISFSQLAKLLSILIFPAYFWHEPAAESPQLLSMLRLLAGKGSVTMGDSCVLALCVGFVYLLFKKWPRVYTAYMIIGILFLGYCFFFPQEITLIRVVEFFFADGLLYAILFCGTNPKAVPASFNGQFAYACCISSIILLGKWFGFGLVSIPFSFAFMNFLLMLISRSAIILYIRRKFVWKG